MSNQEHKDKHSKRLQKETNAIRKQMKIAKSHGIPANQYEGHRYAKHHAMDCGNPDCHMCGNPRHIMKDSATIQEKSFGQTEAWTQD